MTELIDGNQQLSEVAAEVPLEELIHVGPGTLCGGYLRTFWHPVLPGRLLENGHTKPMRILGEDFTLYRGDTGAVHAVDFRCAHRGTQLSTGWVEGDCVRCLYHGWKYDETGQCVEQPDENERFAAHIKIRSYPIREYIGLIWMYFGDGEPPVMPRYRNFEEDPNDRESYITTNTYTWPCSYFNSLENDSYHGNWVHRETYAAMGRLPGNGEQRVVVEETEYGMVSHISREGVRRFAETDRVHMMPNGNYRRSSTDSTENSWSEAINWRIPIDDEHFMSCNVDKFHGTEEELARIQARRKAKSEQLKDLPTAFEIAEKVLAGEMRLTDFPGRLEGVSDTRLFGIGDYATQVGQGTFALLQDEHLGRTDVEVALLRHLFRREIQAFAAGQPLKNWQIPELFNARVSED